ncbi:MAG TPA: pantoate--beta-alanine ligase [Rubrobacteraceae bacterium]|nr:pantoate--beta-alanine ligase [Rubrobacteraceae bacterium]HZG62361.1 pantoate--beta-alanine ligase [Rubrobacteraceae bacterium]
MSREIKTLKTVAEMRAYGTERPLGLVPTLGYLHEGHLSLIRRAREECAAVVVSVFVNPLQFGPGEDLARYPRDLERDRELARKAGADAVFIPETAELYPEGYTTEVRVRGIEDVLEGAARPGHFAGVATVLAKLLNIVVPDRMYMGQKDAQQSILVGRMIRDLNFPTRLVVAPTVRELDGLAMSSRNVYLNEEERAVASAIPRALSVARDTKSKDPEVLEKVVREEVAKEPLVQLEYVFANDGATLGPVGPQTGEVLLSLAARVGKTRLIDNVVIGRE